GAAMVYFFFTPMVMWFFLAMQQIGPDQEVTIELLPRVSEYLSLIMTLILAFGLVFQLPVVTTLMARVGLLSAQALVDKRKWAIVIAFIVAAVITPPDPVSQIGLALPTIILYEVSLILVRRIEARRAREQAKRDTEAESATEANPAEQGGRPHLLGRRFRLGAGRRAPRPATLGRAAERNDELASSPFAVYPGCARMRVF